MRRCESPLIKRSATEAFINVKQRSVPKEPVVLSQSDQQEGSSQPSTSDPNLTLSAIDNDLDPVIPGTQSAQTVLGLETQTGTLIDDQSVAQSASNRHTRTEKIVGSFTVQRQSVEKTRRSVYAQQRVEGQSSEVRRLTFDDESSDFRLERISSKKGPGKLPTKLMKKLELNQKYTKKEGGVCPVYFNCSKILVNT